MARLVVRKGRNIGAEHRLNADRLTMGRRSASPIPILDPKASREHAAVLRRGERFFIVDLSRNGVWVNGAPVAREAEAPTPLQFGDRIQVGDTVLEMVDETKEPIGIEVPGYQILERIGSGGMGTVYRARQLSMDRVVALKVLNDKYSHNREFVDRFIREARAAGKLNHPNVIHVHDVSRAHGLHYFSMEFVDGFSVKELLRIHGHLPPAQTVDIVLQTARALEFAHENHIVHRDIKPDNLMLTKDGVVKIADLGIAKSFDEVGATGANIGQRVMGTPHYMAPEQALGKEIDHRVDVYSLGATCYHMLTGHTPFSGLTAHEVIRAHMQESLPPIHDFQPGVPDGFCFVVERMMAKLPERRYPNMTRLIEDLSRVQKGIVDGIERLDEGASTIQRAPKARGVLSATDSIGTGLHAPVARIVVYVLLAALFVGLGVAAWFLFRPAATERAGHPPLPPPDQGVRPPGPPEVNPEVRDKLAEAKALLAGDPVSPEAERLLRDLATRFPTQDEPKRCLAALVQAREASLRKELTAEQDRALAFEKEIEAMPERFSEAAQRWRAIEQRAGAVPEVQARARERAEYWERRLGEAEAGRVQAAWQAASAAAAAAMQSKDFDAARQALREFAAAHDTPEWKNQTDQQLAAVEAAAEQSFTQTTQDAEQKERDPAHPIPLALAVWDQYLERVKDAPRLEAAQNARKALADRAERAAQDEDARVTELTKQYDYERALQRLRLLRERLAGTPWAEARQGRVEEVTLQRDLHRRVLAAIAQSCRTGPVPFPLPFKLKIGRLEVEDWGIAGPSDNELTLKLEALVRGSAPGCLRKFCELRPEEQYKLYTTFVPPRTAADHRAYAVFCRERGLTAQAEAHALQASPAVPPPAAEP